MIDPIAALFERKGVDEGAVPAPLVRMGIEVTIRGGLALVETVRTYANREQGPIEALLSIPVPVHAAFFGLTAKLDGKLYRSMAMSREAARESYEGAVDEGKAAVLHEELLRGVHAISLANLAPGQEAQITTRWAEALRFHGDCGRLRIPLTVGDVYGVSGLQEPDDLAQGGPGLQTELRIRHDASCVQMPGGAMAIVDDRNLRTLVPGNAPIDLEVSGWSRGKLAGRAADGREVSLAIQPATAGEESLDAAVLVDHSGSMQSGCDGFSEHSLTKSEVVRRSLASLAGRLREGDRLALWEFDHDCRPVGSGQPVGPSGFAPLVQRLSGPAGGTEIGAALDAIDSVDARDVLLITDGMSYALDVQRHALAGRRVFVALVGEDSLEANVGHLAALTGGDLQFSFGSEVETALRACVQGMRTRRAQDAVCDVGKDGSPRRVRTARGNAAIEARWTGDPRDCERDPFSAAVAAYAASLAVASCDEERAASVAVAEGLVTHLTSLFLEVQDGTRQDELPTLRKVRLPAPRTALQPPAGAVFSSVPPILMQRPSGPVLASVAEPAPLPSARQELPPAGVTDYHWIASRIDWDVAGPALARGDLGRVPRQAADAIRHVSRLPDIAGGARELGMDSVNLAIALIARSAADTCRPAARVYRRLLRDVDPDQFEGLARKFDPGPV